MVVIYTEAKRCRLCDGPLRMVGSLGEHFITNFVPIDRAGEEFPRAPLTLMRCVLCSLVQLRNSVNPDVLYKGLYWYRSGMNKTMTDHLHALAQEAEREARLVPGDYVVDIGCNDGTFFDGFTTKGLKRIGFEPGPNTGAIAVEKGYTVVQDFFDAKYWPPEYPRAKLVSAIAMLYDVENPQAFVSDVAKILAPDGVFLLQMNDLHAMVSRNTYDIVGHEHITYWSFKPLMRALAYAGLVIYRFSYNDLNGGSLRAYIGIEGTSSVRPDVRLKATLEETELAPDKLDAFFDGIRQNSAKIHDFVEAAVADGQRVYVYGASTRGNTILQAAGLDGKLISGAAEIHPDKIGKVIAGLNIPIVSEAEARRMAGVFLVLPYSYRKEFQERERDFLLRGGRLAFPLPKFEVVGGI